MVKPTTYVNQTGIAVKEILESFDVKLEDLLIIADDVNLQTGKIRIRKSGGDGGHNGIASIIYHVESNQFPRLRFGIGNDFEKGQMADFVLDKFSDEDVKIIKPAINSAIETIEHFIEGGYNTALNFSVKLISNLITSPKQLTTKATRRIIWNQ